MPPLSIDAFNYSTLYDTAAAPLNSINHTWYQYQKLVTLLSSYGHDHRSKGHEHTQ